MTGSSKIQRLTRTFATALGIAILALSGGAMAAKAPDAAAPATSRANAQAELASNDARPATSLEISSYATREAQEASAGLEKFQGGDTTIIIGASAVAVVLLVLLILVLL